MGTLWTFSSLVESSRSVELLAVGSFRDLLSRITSGSVRCVELEPRWNPPCSDCRRAVFRVSVPERDYDAFFNSPVGYRAQFCVGVANGEKCNRDTLAGFEQACLAALRRQANLDVSEEFVTASVRAEGAKVWINESDLAGLEGIHIEYPPWIAKYHAASVGTMAEQEARSLAFAGVLAPRGIALEIKGGWITANGHEWLDPSKASRSQEIRDYGFT
jgi:hypothetical protein